MTTRPDKERRRHPRYKVRVKVELSNATRTLSGSSRDLSESGIFAYVGECPPADTEVQLTLTDTKLGMHVKATGKVVHCLQNVGIGICFTDLSDEEQAKLDELLSHAIRNKREGSEEEPNAAILK